MFVSGMEFERVRESLAFGCVRVRSAGGENPEKIPKVARTFRYILVPRSVRYLGYFGNCGFLNGPAFFVHENWWREFGSRL